jgi:hypothetical protein
VYLLRRAELAVRWVVLELAAWEPLAARSQVDAAAGPEREAGPQARLLASAQPAVTQAQAWSAH